MGDSTIFDLLREMKNSAVAGVEDATLVETESQTKKRKRPKVIDPRHLIRLPLLRPILPIHHLSIPPPFLHQSPLRPSLPSSTCTHTQTRTRSRSLP